MIRSKFALMMAEHKVRSIAELARITKLNRRTLTNLYDDKNTGIDYATLDALCKHFNCSIGDLLEYVEEEKGK